MKIQIKPSVQVIVPKARPVKAQYEMPGNFGQGLHQSAESAICTDSTFSARNGQVIYFTPNCIWGFYRVPLQGWELLPIAVWDPKNLKV